jgi:hypothetical protein
MVKVTKDLIRQRAVAARAKAYFEKAQTAGWHVAATEVLRAAEAKKPWDHRSPDIDLIHEAAKEHKMTSSFSKSILVFHPPKTKAKGRAKNK